MNKQIYPNQRGSVFIFLAVLMLVLMALAGLALDVGYISLQKTRMQNVADATALACSLKTCPVGTIASPQTSDDIFSEVNTFPSTFTARTINPVTCPSSTQSNCNKAIVTADEPWQNFFSGGTSNVSVSAISGFPFQAPCMVTLSNFTVNGSTPYVGGGCPIAVGGTLQSSNSVITDPGSAVNLYNYVASGPNKSNSCGNNCSGVTINTYSSGIPNLPTYTTPSPGAGTAPTKCTDGSTCTCNGDLASDGTSGKTCTWNPGNYSNIKLASNHIHVLNSGNYVFPNGLNTNGSTVNSATTGSNPGVSLYVSNTLTLTGNVNLSAQASSNCASGSGVVLNHLSANPNNNPFKYDNTTAQVTLNGVVNLSLDDVTFTSAFTSPNYFKVNGTLITNSMTQNGNSAINTAVPSSPCYAIAGGRPILLK